MTNIPNMDGVKQYFEDRLIEHGPTARGADWNSTASQEIRFEQLLKVVDFSEPFSILDYGCGYGALADFLSARVGNFDYLGFDLLPDMVSEAQNMHRDQPNCHFSDNLTVLGEADYAVLSGVFNVRLATPQADWTQYVLDVLTQLNRISHKGFAFNMLTSYSDKDYMRDHLYYADPCFIFDYCKKHFSRNVALLHDYEIYDFTILVRKNLMGK